MYLLFSCKDTRVTTVSIEPQSVTALVGSSPVVFTCTITLNHDIGPHHSALNVVWTQDANSSVAPKLGLHSVFNSSITLSTHSPSSRKEYCCNAGIIGTNALSNCSSIEVLGKKVLFMLLVFKDFTEIVITGQYQQIQLGSTSTVTCSVPELMNSNIKWISHDGAVVSSSGVLMLFGDHTIDGRIFRCVVTSTQVHSSGKKGITVTVKSKPGKL